MSALGMFPRGGGVAKSGLYKATGRLAVYQEWVVPISCPIPETMVGFATGSRTAPMGRSVPEPAFLHYSTAINGFRYTGIWPCDRHVFTEVEYAAAARFEDGTMNTSSAQLRLWRAANNDTPPLLPAT